MFSTTLAKVQVFGFILTYITTFVGLIKNVVLKFSFGWKKSSEHLFIPIRSQVIYKQLLGGILFVQLLIEYEKLVLGQGFRNYWNQSQLNSCNTPGRRSVPGDNENQQSHDVSCMIQIQMCLQFTTLFIFLSTEMSVLIITDFSDILCVAYWLHFHNYALFYWIMFFFI